MQTQLEKAQQHLLSLEQEHHIALDSARAAQQLHQQELESLRMKCSEVEEQLQTVEMELRTMTEERDRLQEALKRLREDLGEEWAGVVFWQLQYSMVAIRIVRICTYV